MHSLALALPAMLAGTCRFLYFVHGIMGNFWSVLEWIGLCLGVVIAGLAVTFVVVRRRILRHVQGELGENSLLLAAGARVGGYDGLSEGQRPARAVGILMLLSSGLYFHSWTGRHEVFIPGASISWIGVPEEPEGGARKDTALWCGSSTHRGSRMALPSV